MNDDFYPLRTVYFDLDGVLADFRQGVIDATGQPPEAFDADTLWQRIAAVPDFFVGLAVLEEGRTLLGMAMDTHRVAILTALPRASTYPDAAHEKRRWTIQHFGALPFFAVQYARQKADYATPSDILIDDNAENIRRWKKAGGIGILHRSFNETVAALRLAVEGGC